MTAKKIHPQPPYRIREDDPAAGGLTDPRFLSPGPADPTAGPDETPIPLPVSEPEQPEEPAVEAGGAGLVDPRVLSPGAEGADVP
jgi:hypothetical protein